jgi:glycosyltransferase involved in cell wall biosynthesis
MRVLYVNKFLFPKGGDAVATLRTGELVARSGHAAFFWGMSHPENGRLPNEGLFVSHKDFNRRHTGVLRSISLGLNVLYSIESRQKIGKFIDWCKPEVVHLNNFAHQISPSIIDEISRRGIPMVMTLHDYKLACGAYFPLRLGRVCEACRGGRHYRCFLNRCVKGSYSKSLLTSTEMYLHHAILGTYRKIQRFISPSLCMIAHLKRMGIHLPFEHLPSFVAVDRPENRPRGRYSKEIAYLGRLSPEKGLVSLLRAVQPSDRFIVHVIGEGEQRAELERMKVARSLDNVHFHGHLPQTRVAEVLGRCRAIVLPSVGLENYPTCLLEAFALGVPGIGARIGGIPEIIRDRQSGLTFEPGDHHELRDKIIALTEDRPLAEWMGQNARQQVESENSAPGFLRQLMSIYHQVAS